MFATPKILTGRTAAPWIAALIAFALVLFAPGIFNDGDTYWHISAGRWMIDNWAVLRIDPFSYTFAGRPWQTHEWLSEILMALGYVGLGWNGVALLFAAAFALAAWLLSRALARKLSGAALAATIILSLACVSGGLLARPHILALPLLVLWSAGLMRARDENRAPSWGLVPAMTLWANLHASFLFGLALVLPLMLEAVWEARKTDAQNSVNSVLRAWGVFFGFSVLAALITPFGVYTLSFPFTLMAMPELYSINEWQPLKIHLLSPFLLSAGAALYILLGRGAKIRPLRLIVLIGLAYLALSQARHQILAAMVAPLLLAEPLADALKRGPADGNTPRRLTVLALTLMIVLTGIRLLWPVQRANDSVSPLTALAHVPDDIRHQPVFNEYRFGGFLVFHRVQPFIDGRAELYGNAFLRQYDRMIRPGSTVLAMTLDRYRVGWTLLDPKNAANDTLSRMKGWRRLYADRHAVVYVRKP